MIAAISHFLKSIIHLFVPMLNLRTETVPLLLFIGLYEAFSLLTGTHIMSPSEQSLLAITAARTTALPHHIEETTSENAP